jgi:uncharacterized protein YlxP (DUF503 family)
LLVAVLTACLLFPGALSLKDKRRRLVGLTARIRAGYPVSVAEVAHHDLWQRGTIGVALVTTDARLAQSMFDRITDGIGRDGEVELLSRRIEYFQPEEIAPRASRKGSGRSFPFSFRGR